MGKYHFFLGGNELSKVEMNDIKEILKTNKIAFSSRYLAKNARASKYLSKITECLTTGKFFPVCVELGDDLIQATSNQKYDDGVILINPLGQNRNKSSIIQVLNLLNIPLCLK